MDYTIKEGANLNETEQETISFLLPNLLKGDFGEQFSAFHILFALLAQKTKNLSEDTARINKLIAKQQGNLTYEKYRGKQKKKTIENASKIMSLYLSIIYDILRQLKFRKELNWVRKEHTTLEEKKEELNANQQNTQNRGFKSSQS